MEEKVRAHVIIHGRVQGVCFRMETQQAAEKIGVGGWVRNQPDGTVEAVFEGTASRIDQVLKWCHNGPPLSKVTHVDLEWERYQGEFKSFEIAF
jgi:acylphosphatase